MKMNKKGVSPLIATVLLIAFTVALGAVVMNWGRSYTSQKMEEVKTTSDKELACARDVQIEWSSISDVDQICYGGEGSTGFISFTVKNTGTTDIESLGINVYGTLDIMANSSINGTFIAVAHPLRKNITYDYTTYGRIDKIEIMPEVKLGGMLRKCSVNPLTKSSSALRNCSD